MDKALEVPQFQDKITKKILVYRRGRVRRLLINRFNDKNKKKEYKFFNKIFVQYQAFLKKLSMQYIREKKKNQNKNTKPNMNNLNKN